MHKLHFCIQTIFSVHLFHFFHILHTKVVSIHCINCIHCIYCIQSLCLFIASIISIAFITYKFVSIHWIYCIYCIYYIKVYVFLFPINDCVMYCRLVKLSSFRPIVLLRPIKTRKWGKRFSAFQEIFASHEKLLRIWI